VRILPSENLATRNATDGSQLVCKLRYFFQCQTTQNIELLLCHARILISSLFWDIGLHAGMRMHAFDLAWSRCNQIFWNLQGPQLLAAGMANHILAGRHTTAGFTLRRPKTSHASLGTRLVVCSLSPERQGAYHDELRQTAKYISRRGFGILVSSSSPPLRPPWYFAGRLQCYTLMHSTAGRVTLHWSAQASDESNMTTGKRLDSVGEHPSSSVAFLFQRQLSGRRKPRGAPTASNHLLSPCRRGQH